MEFAAPPLAERVAYEQQARRLKLQEQAELRELHDRTLEVTGGVLSTLNGLLQGLLFDEPAPIPEEDTASLGLSTRW